MNTFEIKNKYTCDDLLKIMEKLRGENGCPWDAEQTHESIRQNMIEEAYEAVEAIDMKNDDMLKEELGDVLLQVAFHAQMAKEEGRFDFDHVADGICKKLVERHPHVFGDVTVNSADDVLNNWEKIKQKSKGQTEYTQTLESVPKVFPGLMRCQKVQKRAAKSGFDYPDLSWALQDLESEIAELKAAVEKEDSGNIFEEIGDIIFSVVNVSRFLGVDSEDAAAKSCDKFIDRFSKVEKLANLSGLILNELSLDELNDLWKEAKEKQKLEENKDD